MWTSTWIQKGLVWHAGHQEISRCCTRVESEESIACRQQNTQVRESTLPLKPRVDIGRSSKQDCQWPHRKDGCYPKKQNPKKRGLRKTGSVPRRERGEKEMERTVNALLRWNLCDLMQSMIIVLSLYLVCLIQVLCFNDRNSPWTMMEWLIECFNDCDKQFLQNSLTDS